MEQSKTTQMSAPPSPLMTQLEQKLYDIGLDISYEQRGTEYLVAHLLEEVYPGQMKRHWTSTVHVNWVQLEEEVLDYLNTNY
jgi:hypothetical protein